MGVRQNIPGFGLGRVVPLNKTETFDEAEAVVLLCRIVSEYPLQAVMMEDSPSECWTLAFRCEGACGAWSDALTALKPTLSRLMP